jgi:hypothetical protein
LSSSDKFSQDHRPDALATKMASLKVFIMAYKKTWRYAKQSHHDSKSPVLVLTHLQDDWCFIEGEWVGEKEMERWSDRLHRSFESRGSKCVQDLKEKGTVAGIMQIQPASIIEERSIRRAAMGP